MSAFDPKRTSASKRTKCHLTANAGANFNSGYIQSLRGRITASPVEALCSGAGGWDTSRAPACQTDWEPFYGAVTCANHLPK